MVGAAWVPALVPVGKQKGMLTRLLRGSVGVGWQGQGGTYHGCCLSAVRAVARLDVSDKGLASLGAVSYQLWMELLPPSLMPCWVLRGLGKHPACRE